MAGGEDLLERDPGNVATAEGTGSALGAWCYLVWLCIQRQARARQMVWIALALLGFTTTVVALVSATRGWGMHHHRWAFEVYELVPGPTAGSRLEPFPPLAEDFPSAGTLRRGFSEILLLLLLSLRFPQENIIIGTGGYP